MSLILKGIDLPEYGELRLIISKNGMIFGAEYPKVRHTYPFNLDAKAIQISKGHGDIKDENEIIKRLEEKEKEPKYQHDTDDWWVGIIDAEDVVNSSPMILEAEE